MNHKKFIQGLIKYRFLVLALVILAFGGSLYTLRNITVDNDTMKSVPADFKPLAELHEMRKVFPVPHTLVCFVSFDKSQYSLAQRIDSVTQWSLHFDTIKVNDVPSISNTIHIGKLSVPIDGGFFGLKTAKIVARNKKKAVMEKRTAKRIAENREFTKMFITEDLSKLGIILQIGDEENRPKVVEQVAHFLDKRKDVSGIQTYLTGATASTYYLSTSVRENLRTFLPISILIASILLFVIFRRVMYVIYSLIVIIIAVVFTFAIMTLSGVPFSVVSSIIPIILFPIGLADSIHVLKTYMRFRLEEGKSFVDSFAFTYAELIKPVILTSLTTFIGFGSFYFSDISWNRHFGVFTGVGVICALLMTVILLPIFLYFESNKKFTLIPHESSLSQNVLAKYRKIVFGTPFCGIFAVVIIAICVWGGMKVKYESNPISMFSESSQIRQSDKLVSEIFGGTRFFTITLTHTDKILTPEQWKELDEIATLIKEEQSVGDVSSLIPLVKKTSMLLNGKEFSQAGISLLLKGKGMFGKKFKKAIDVYITEDRKTVKFEIICKNLPEFKYTELAKRLEEKIENKYSHWNVATSGIALLIDSMITLLIKTQFMSVSIAFGSVFVLLALLYRSFRTGLFATLPIVLSTVFTYALMGIMGVDINTVTVIIVNTCIGIGIDYSIHFTSGFLFVKGAHRNNEEALLETVKEKGSVIFFNSVVVGTGFLILVFSSFPPIRHFGFFISVSMFVSTLFSLIFLPALFRYYRNNG